MESRYIAMRHRVYDPKRGEYNGQDWLACVCVKTGAFKVLIERCPESRDDSANLFSLFCSMSFLVLQRHVSVEKL